MYHVHVHSRIVHSIALLTVSSWESGAGMDLGPGAWGNLLKGAKALGLKNWRTKRALSTEFTMRHTGSLHTLVSAPDPNQPQCGSLPVFTLELVWVWGRDYTNTCTCIPLHGILVVPEGHYTH